MCTGRSACGVRCVATGAVGAQDTLLPMLTRRLHEPGSLRAEHGSSEGRAAPRGMAGGGVPSSGVKTSAGANATDERRFVPHARGLLPDRLEINGLRTSGDGGGGGSGGSEGQVSSTSCGGAVSAGGGTRGAGAPGVGRRTPRVATILSCLI